MFRLLRSLYDWVLHWANTPYGPTALFALTFAEASFFPIPPDVLLIALCLSVPAKSFRFALLCTVGSIMGGMFGYFLGMEFYESIGTKIIDFYHLTEKYELVSNLYNEYNALAVGIAGFTPIPYKLFTILAGVCEINFPVFVIASFVSRGLRFFLVAGLIWKFGAPIKAFIDKYFNLLTIAFTVLLIGGFLVLKVFL